MKNRIIILLMLALISSGCTTMSYDTPEGSTVRISRVFTNAEFADLEVDITRTLKDGTIEHKKVTIKGYKSNPSHEALKAIAEGLAKGSRP